MSDKKFKKYFDLKNEIAEKQAKLKKLSNELFTVVNNEDNSVYNTKFAKFTLRYRVKYEYSKKLVEAEKLTKEKFKVLKKKEELDGTARHISDNGYIVMKKKKI